MRASLLLAASAALLRSTSHARAQLHFGSPDLKPADELNRALSATSSALLGATHWAAEGVRKFSHRFDHHAHMDYETFQHEDFPQYQIRMKEPKLGCGETEKAYSGYLDIDEETHLFFWFYESRNDPAKDPLTLWLNGGPGCSSATGLLFELGPCQIANGGENTTYNPFAWNAVSNVIFLDQPVGVGYSYGKKTVSDSRESAEDVYAFLQLFYLKFPRFAGNDVHISGESYAGTYVPNVGAVINDLNKAPPTPASLHIPLKSLIIGNGLTQMEVQMPATIDYGCSPSPYAFFNETTCASMRAMVPKCERLAALCHLAPSRLTCAPANQACYGIRSAMASTGLNNYDIRRACDHSQPGGCYEEMGWVDTYLNKPEVKTDFGAAEERTFEGCSEQVAKAFQFSGDASHLTKALIPPLLADGIRILLYAGEFDYNCNFEGVRRWSYQMDWPLKEEFNAAPKRDWLNPRSGEAAGKVHQVGEGAGLFTYLKFYGAGHMVPFDQAENSLDMYARWIRNERFA